VQLFCDDLVLSLTPTGQLGSLSDGLAYDGYWPNCALSTGLNPRAMDEPASDPRLATVEIICDSAKIARLGDAVALAAAESGGIITGCPDSNCIRSDFAPPSR
jgi:hypothetical protein